MRRLPIGAQDAILPHKGKAHGNSRLDGVTRAFSSSLVGKLLDFGEVEEAAGGVGVGEADFEFVADIDAVDPLRETAFHGRVEDADEGSLVSDAGGDG